MLKLLIILTFISNTLFASSDAPTGDGFEDTKSTVKWMLKGSYMQFQERNNLYYLGAGAAVSWYSFKHDDRLAALAQTKKIHDFVDFVGDAGIALSFPFAAMGAWYYGKKSKNTKLMQFMMEYSAAMYLTLAESGILSYIQIHKRPSQENLSFWEEDFRGSSSWPSGHVVPYATLFFKTLQFYGPAWALIPLGFTVVASMQRMQDGKHYLSDTVGAFFFSAFSSEGVRRAANYSGNHEFYKRWLEHDVQMGVTRYKKSWGPTVSFSF